VFEGRPTVIIHERRRGAEVKFDCGAPVDLSDAITCRLVTCFSPVVQTGLTSPLSEFKWAGDGHVLYGRVLLESYG